MDEWHHFYHFRWFVIFIISDCSWKVYSRFLWEMSHGYRYKCISNLSKFSGGGGMSISDDFPAQCTPRHNIWWITPPPPPSPGQYKTSSTATHVHGSIKHPFPVISFLFKNWFATRCEYLHLINNNSQCFFTRSEFFLIRCKYRICDDWKRGISRILQISSTIYKAQEKD